MRKEKKRLQFFFLIITKKNIWGLRNKVIHPLFRYGYGLDTHPLDGLQDSQPGPYGGVWTPIPGSSFNHRWVYKSY